MIAWTTTTEALEYATMRLDDAIDVLRNGVRPQQPVSDQLATSLEAMADAVCALVMVKHMRQGDALVTIDQLAADLAPSAAQPLRTCCQTYPAESHARGCYVTARTAMTDRTRAGLL